MFHADQCRRRDLQQLFAGRPRSGICVGWTGYNSRRRSRLLRRTTARRMMSTTPSSAMTRGTVTRHMSESASARPHPSPATSEMLETERNGWNDSLRRSKRLLSQFQFHHSPHPCLRSLRRRHRNVGFRFRLRMRSHKEALPTRILVSVPLSGGGEPYSLCGNRSLGIA